MNPRWEPFAGRRVAHVLVVDRVGGRIAYGPTQGGVESEALCSRIGEPSGLSPATFKKCAWCLTKLQALTAAGENGCSEQVA